ncbi:sporulation protein [Bacillus songklensis]|uniref:Sporulation protein n=1 Tax=Bacillus songklensis TaxID=1069116 RepID=A0ABV8B2M3_9BACI
MFKKFLAKLGKGAATVDLQFENRPYQIDEVIHGEVVLKGGEVDQQINQLAVKFMMTVTIQNSQSISRKVDMIPLTGSFVISKKEEKRIPFHYRIPPILPLSRGPVSYYFDTHLDIEGGVDRTDVDYVTIGASKEVQSIFNALSRLGFREKATSGKLDTYGQEFEFFSTQLLANQINELEIRFAYVETGIQVWMEVDCRSGYGEIEAKREFILTKELLENEDKLVARLEEYIVETVQQPELYRQPFSYHAYEPHHQGGIAGGIGSMVGGLAMGVLGGMVLNEMMDSFGVDEMVEDAAESIGLDEEDFDLAGMDFGDFSDDED